MDQYIYEKTEYKTYTVNDGYVSYQTELEETDAPVYLFNQRYQELAKDDPWYNKYLLKSDNKPKFTQLSNRGYVKLNVSN